MRLPRPTIRFVAVPLLLAIALISTTSIGQTGPESEMSVSDVAVMQMPKAAHFTTPEGEYIVVAAGDYEVSLLDKALHLTPLDGRPPFIISATESSPHDEDIDGLTAIAFSGQTDEDQDLMHVTLLLTDGRYFSTIGSVSGIRSRGMLKRAKNRQTTRQEIRANRQTTRQENRAKRQEEGTSLESIRAASQNRQETRQENRASRQDMRQDNRSDWLGLPQTARPDPWPTGHNAFHTVFNKDATNLHWGNAYLLTYLATLVYPEFLDQLGPRTRDKYWITQERDYVRDLHKNPSRFIKEYASYTRHLMIPSGSNNGVQFAFLAGSGVDRLTSTDNRVRGWDPEAVVISTDSIVFVVIRGTDRVGDSGSSTKEWRHTNYDARLTNPDFGNMIGKVHGGFWNSLRRAEPTDYYPDSNDLPNPSINTNDGFAEAMHEMLTKYNVSNKKLWITGHSLGGAHAQLLAVYLAKHESPIMAQGVYAIAAPNIGDTEFANQLDNILTQKKVRRFEFMDDLVPMLPTGIRFDVAGCRVAYTALGGENREYPGSLRSSTSGYESDTGPCPSTVTRLQNIHTARANFTYHYPHWFLWAAYGELTNNQKNLGPDHKSLPLPTTEGDIYSEATPRAIARALGLL